MYAIRSYYECLDDQAGGKDLVAWRVQQVGARNVGVAHRLALATTQAIANIVVERTQLRSLEQQRFLLNQTQ